MSSAILQCASLRRSSSCFLSTRPLLKTKGCAAELSKIFEYRNFELTPASSKVLSYRVYKTLRGANLSDKTARRTRRFDKPERSTPRVHRAPSPCLILFISSAEYGIDVRKHTCEDLKVDAVKLLKDPRVSDRKLHLLIANYQF